MQIQLLTITIAAMLVSSCSTMSKRECQSGEWQNAGYSDALTGLKSSRFSTHAKACAKHSVAPDEKLYTEGYNVGLNEYCRPEVGLGKGRNTNDYRGICPADLEPGFLAGYIKGLELALYDLNSQYSNTRIHLQNARFSRIREYSADNQRRIDRRISALEQKIRDIRQERSTLRNAIALWQLRRS